MFSPFYSRPYFGVSAEAPALSVPLQGPEPCWASGAGGLDQRPWGPGLARQGNITLLWNEVVPSSRCKEMGIYVTVGMVFIFSNFQITFD